MTDITIDDAFFDRNKYPFKDMAVGEVVVLDYTIQRQRYVHNYGCATGKKFKTRKHENALYVKRVK